MLLNLLNINVQRQVSNGFQSKTEQQSSKGFSEAAHEDFF